MKPLIKVMAVMASEGISKSRKNQQQGYNFRGIDDVYNSLADQWSMLDWLYCRAFCRVIYRAANS